MRKTRKSLLRRPLRRARRLFEEEEFDEIAIGAPQDEDTAR
jgi:hypothetical protein